MLEHSFPREHPQQTNTVQVSLHQGGLKPTIVSTPPAGHSQICRSLSEACGCVWAR